MNLNQRNKEYQERGLKRILGNWVVFLILPIFVICLLGYQEAKDEEKVIHDNYEEALKNYPAQQPYLQSKIDTNTYPMPKMGKGDLQDDLRNALNKK